MYVYGMIQYEKLPYTEPIQRFDISVWVWKSYYSSVQTMLKITNLEAMKLKYSGEIQIYFSMKRFSVNEISDI